MPYAYYLNFQLTITSSSNKDYDNSKGNINRLEPIKMIKYRLINKAGKIAANLKWCKYNFRGAKNENT